MSNSDLSKGIFLDKGTVIKKGGGVLREFIVDQRDGLQYMVQPLCCTDDGVRHIKSNPSVAGTDACDGRGGRSANMTVLVFEDEITYARNSHSALDRPLQRGASMGSIFHLC